MTPELSLSAAAEATGVTKQTISRRRKAGHFPNARRDGTGHNAPWMIPAVDLVAAGLTLEADKQPRTKAPGVSHPGATATIDFDELDKLRADLTDYRRRAEVAEAIAEERARTIDAQQLALRALTTGTDTASATQSPADGPDQSPAPITPTAPRASLVADLTARFRRSRR